MEVSAENQARISFPSKMAKGLEVREKIITLHKRGMNRPLAWGIVYTVLKCPNAPNLIFAIKQGVLETTFDIYNSLIVQLA